MKVLGPLQYSTWNYGVVLLLPDCWYIVTLNKVVSLKYSFHNQEPFLFSNPVEKLEEENLHQFLQEHEVERFYYGEAEQVEMKHSWWNKSKIYITARGKQYTFGILERGKSRLYEEWLSETFQGKFSVEGTYTM